MRKLFSLVICVGLMAAPLGARAAEAEPMAALVEVLKESKDAQLQLDVLKGMSAALKGVRSAPMPLGWAEVEAKLTASKNAQISTLAQSLGLTFGSQKALESLRRTALDAKAEIGARRAAVQ
ncbi:MAG TPA: hypothetical protein VM680_09695, partial [Verrucomicrobiae bacterium]|nr:hypothetical protein [Verrucomicrobiae bacterium]